MRKLPLTDGTIPVRDVKYIRNKILYPNKGAEVAGYPKGVMPSYKGVLKENEILDIVAYIKTLK